MKFSTFPNSLAARVVLYWASKLNPRSDQLTSLANRYGSDKGSGRRGHHYTRVYSELFRDLRDRPVRLLEIGLLGLRTGGWDDNLLRDAGGARGRDAPSLRLWSHYFPRGEIFGFDLNHFSGVEIARCRIFQGDSSCPADLRALFDEIGGKLDIVIDDASHASHHQQIALETLFPAVAPGGVYVIEDLFFQPAVIEPPAATKTVDVLRRAEVTGEFRGSHLSPEGAAYLEQHVERIALLDSLVCKGPLRHRDSLAVLWKKA